MSEVHSQARPGQCPQDCLPSAEQQPERRRARRIALSLAATVREFGQPRMMVRVIDISTHGCRIEKSCGQVSEPWLWLSIAGLQTQYCRVAWQSNEFLGLEFAAPLNDASLATFLDAQSRFTETAMQDLRDIAGRIKRLASLEADAGQRRMLLDFSRDCTVNAVSLGLRLCEREAAGESCAEISGSLIRRSEAMEEPAPPG